MNRPAVWLHRAKVVDLKLMEHLAAVVASDAIPVATDFDGMIEQLEIAFDDPSRKSAERAALIKQYLAPLDGHAGERLVGTIVEAAGVTAGKVNRYIRPAA